MEALTARREAGQKANHSDLPRGRSAEPRIRAAAPPRFGKFDKNRIYGLRLTEVLDRAK
jgi:hypothetical protein